MSIRVHSWFSILNDLPGKLRIALVAATLIGFAGWSSADEKPAVKKEKLQIVFLFGQSNMVGHANYITVPRLFADERPEVQELAKLVFKLLNLDN